MSDQGTYTSFLQHAPRKGSRLPPVRPELQSALVRGVCVYRTWTAGMVVLSLVGLRSNKIPVCRSTLSRRGSLSRVVYELRA